MSELTKRQALEQLIDTTTLHAVLAALEDICGEKADHLRTNWQDQATARLWERTARRIAVAVRDAAESGI